ncbi:MAG: N-acetylglucosamine-6-phosphate deacetylase [Schwartzia sp.]|nr:N-acetylglucosamine-6-phosphate deacetylase [Schwartzia sp. (in: firmicutes)]
MKAILGGRLIVEDERGEFCALSDHALLYEKKIARIVPTEALGEETRASLEEEIDAKGAFVAPGFIDVHLHGAAGRDAMDDDEAAVRAIARYQPSHGVTAILPTTMTCDFSAVRHALGHIRAVMSQREPKEARVLGAHMEGPFISAARCGAQDAAHILPADFSFVEPFLDVVKRITIAPEELPEGSRFIRDCQSRGVSISIGHSDADYDEALRFLTEEGIRHVTHLFNGMPPFHHRAPGVVGAALDTDADCELIADNLHSHPAAHRMLWRAKGGRHILLITDSIRAAGIGDGESELGGQKVYVRGASATLADGTLAGSVLTMDRAVANFAKNTGCGIPTAVACAAKTPADGLGLYGEIGSLAPNKRADIVIFDDDVHIQKTIIDGEIVFENK